uniref:Uncharacterized protein n=1 Tax=Corethron hystrix TaxID=216773 RepID=A0A7S1B4J6_9STRA|mmetsp:Transcript_1264/g.2572  ORF Transcript_1264/g.2572 Transcript_1264/m.2572 type:complete len:141 (+) Transcript_1264:660-1082(+)
MRSLLFLIARAEVPTEIQTACQLESGRLRKPQDLLPAEGRAVRAAPVDLPKDLCDVDEGGRHAEAEGGKLRVRGVARQGRVPPKVRRELRDGGIDDLPRDRSATCPLISSDRTTKRSSGSFRSAPAAATGMGVPLCVTGL